MPGNRHFLSTLITPAFVTIVLSFSAGQMLVSIALLHTMWWVAPESRRISSLPVTLPLYFTVAENNVPDRSGLQNVNALKYPMSHAYSFSGSSSSGSSPHSGSGFVRRYRRPSLHFLMSFFFLSLSLPLTSGASGQADFSVHNFSGCGTSRGARWLRRYP